MKIEQVNVLGPYFRFVANEAQAADAKDGWTQGLSVTYEDETGFTSQCHVKFDCEKTGEFKPEVLGNALRALAKFIETKGV